MNLAIEQVESGNYNDALSSLDEVLKLDSSDERANNLKNSITLFQEIDKLYNDDTSESLSKAVEKFKPINNEDIKDIVPKFVEALNNKDKELNERIEVIKSNENKIKSIEENIIKGNLAEARKLVSQIDKPSKDQEEIKKSLLDKVEAKQKEIEENEKKQEQANNKVNDTTNKKPTSNSTQNNTSNNTSNVEKAPDGFAMIDKASVKAEAYARKLEQENSHLEYFIVNVGYYPERVRKDSGGWYIKVEISSSYWRGPSEGRTQDVYEYFKYYENGNFVPIK